jgi:DNA-binding XRE family transcriptional regulator
MSLNFDRMKKEAEVKEYKAMKMILHELGVNATSFAKQCEVKRQVIDRLAHGDFRPSYETTRAILVAFPSINPYFLFELSDEIYVGAGTTYTGSAQGCKLCKEKEKHINDLRKLCSVLEDNYERMKDECDKLKGGKKGMAVA